MIIKEYKCSECNCVFDHLLQDSVHCINCNSVNLVELEESHLSSFEPDCSSCNVGCGSCSCSGSCRS